MTTLEILKRLDACDPSREWAIAHPDPEEAWASCERGDWLLWLAAKVGVKRRLIVRAACACARTSLAYVPAGEDRPLQAIETAERWCEGLASLKEVRKAVLAADDAADLVARAARAAAAAASHAALAASCVAHAASCAAHTASCAALAADVDEDDVAFADALKRLAVLVRGVISWDQVRSAPKF